MERLKSWLREFWGILADVSSRRLGTYAAAGTFYLFLSLVPLVLVVLTVLPYTPLTEATLVEVLDVVLPDGVTSLIRDIVEHVYEASAATLSVSVVLTVWSASLALAALLRGLGAAYGAERRGGYILNRLRAMVLLVVFLAGVLVSLVLMVYGGQLLELVGTLVPGLQRGLSLLRLLRHPAAAAYLALSFAVLYRCTPGAGRFRDCWPGALLAAVMWMVFSVVYSVYVRFSNKYGIYGVLGSVIIAMLWAYYCQYFLLIGACVNRWRRERMG